MKNLCIIQARLGSDRLPGKVLQPIGEDKCIVQMAYERLLSCHYVDDVIVAIPTGEKDDELAAFLEAGPKPVYIGSSLVVGSSNSLSPASS